MPILKKTCGLMTSVVLVASVALPINAEDKIELETTTIKGNAELPKILYVVPWKDETNTSNAEQRLVLHSLFGDLFEPVSPAAPDKIK